MFKLLLSNFVKLENALAVCFVLFCFVLVVVFSSLSSAETEEAGKADKGAQSASRFPFLIKELPPWDQAGSDCPPTVATPIGSLPRPEDAKFRLISVTT